MGFEVIQFEEPLNQISMGQEKIYLTLPQSAVAAIDATPRQSSWARLRAEEATRIEEEKKKEEKAKEQAAGLAKMNALSKALGASLKQKVSHMLKVEQDKIEFQK